MYNIITEENIQNYISQFGVLDQDENMNNDNICGILYAMILKKFRITVSYDEHILLRQYQEKVFDLIENMREHNSTTISYIIDFISDLNQYLADVIIMLWCLPRAYHYNSKNVYNTIYVDNIQKYNNKLVEIIDNTVVKNFCIETLTKTNSVPVHCIDYLWRYMQSLSFEFSFINYSNGDYINITIPDDVNDEYIEIGFNMEYILKMGLGQTVYPAKIEQGSFRNLLKRFVVEPVLVNKLLTSKSKSNYYAQIIKINKNPAKYFGKGFVIPDKIVNILNEYKNKAQ